jgi:hypothetical protein
MKRTLSTILVVGILYATGFAILRYRLHSTNIEVLSVSSSGQATLINLQQHHTIMSIPASGLGRPLKQTVYWLFYPAGQLDRFLTGRVYMSRDAKNDWVEQ